MIYFLTVLTLLDLYKAKSKHLQSLFSSKINQCSCYNCNVDNENYKGESNQPNDSVSRIKYYSQALCYLKSPHPNKVIFWINLSYTKFFFPSTVFLSLNIKNIYAQFKKKKKMNDEIVIFSKVLKQKFKNLELVRVTFTQIISICKKAIVFYIFSV